MRRTILTFLFVLWFAAFSVAEPLSSGSKLHRFDGPVDTTGKQEIMAPGGGNLTTSCNLYNRSTTPGESVLCLFSTKFVVDLGVEVVLSNPEVFVLDPGEAYRDVFIEAKVLALKSVSGTPIVSSVCTIKR